MMKRYGFCGGKVVSKHVNFIHEHDEQLLVIRDVPAEVCTACGERTYSPEITDEILRFAKQRFKPVKLIQVLVFDYGHNKVAAAA
jgi:YgiT-type zinc finger domain-containing protein